MFLYASDFPLNMNIVGQHKVINQLLLDNFPEVDGKCKWSQLQRVYLNVMRAFDFKYGKNTNYEETSGTLNKSKIKQQNETNTKSEFHFVESFLIRKFEILGRLKTTKDHQWYLRN